MADEQQPMVRYDLSGRVALIPGGLGGAGQAISRAFLESGAVVVAAERSEHAGNGDPFREQLGDLAERFSVYRLDILVNLVGGWMAGQPITGLEYSTWERMLDINLNAAFLLAKHAARPMTQQNWGRIIHVSSRAARSGRRNAAAYAIAKNAVVTLAEVQAEELRDANITVNAILPSIIDTPANRASMPGSDFSRWPKAEEVARVLLFLASEDAKLISGASIPVYGRG